ncbi:MULTISPECIES: 26S protease regulatory subunit [Acidiplasma]|nr:MULTISPECIES: ATP-binding protein [Acidiplasma]WMT55700.1 MAG: ATP-binding protein [Acidiplasma sp.]
MIRRIEEMEDLYKINRTLETAIKMEAEGKLEEAIKNYKEAYIHMVELARESKGAERKKRAEQAEQILKTYKRLENSDAGEDRLEKGKKILESLNIEPPEIPKITFDDVAGLNDVKNEILSKIIYPMRYKELSQEYNIEFGGGMLLFGPPGTGKTFIVKAIANEVKANFINVNPSSLYSQWFGQFEKNISQLFRAAYLLSPSIIFFDEIDTLVPKRSGTESDAAKRGVSQLLTEVGGLTSEKDKNIFIIAATNNPWAIDEAILRPGRFDVKIYVPPPDFDARVKLFQLKLSKIKPLGNIDYEELAKLTERYSGADIEFICKKAVQNVFMEVIKTGNKIPVTTDDIISVIYQIKPSIDERMLEKYREYMAQ